MSAEVLVVEGLRVEYEEVVAVDDVSFSIEAGQVYGLIGPNGAGKTSIIRSVASLLEPTWGRIHINGLDLLESPTQALRHIGFMPDFPPLYEDLTVYEFLDLFASAYNLYPTRRKSRIEELLERVQLSAKVDQPAGGLSRGMKQRLFLAKTLLHDPKLLLLDEPASGLDPLARIALKDIIVGLGKAGKAVLVSSHILPEMADFCNSVGIMERGKMVVSGRIETILSQLKPGFHFVVRLLAADPRLESWLNTRDGVKDVQVKESTAKFSFDGAEDLVAQLLRALVMDGFEVRTFEEEKSNLQDIFMQVSTGQVS